MVEVPFAPAEAMVMAGPLNAKVGTTGAVFTVAAMGVDAVKAPEVPVTVAV